MVRLPHSALPSLRRRLGESGQVMVEQAIILPVMIFLILGILQMAMIQHARICSEYAAFNAARAGIVFNGDPDKMQRAAFISLLPSMGRSDSMGELAETAAWMVLMQLGSSIGGSIADVLGINSLSEMDMVQVRIVDHPDASIGNRTTVLDAQQHLNKKQIDFDDFRDKEAKANQLTIEVLYYYEMRIPFANWMIQTIWLAGRLNMLENFGGIGFATPEYTVGSGPFSVNTGVSANMMTTGKALTSGEKEIITVLAYRAAPSLYGLKSEKRKKGQYRLPIKTWYTMRMQSNLYRTHAENPSSASN